MNMTPPPPPQFAGGGRGCVKMMGEAVAGGGRGVYSVGEMYSISGMAVVVWL